eukprot:512067-Amphidinium_carterae.2
MLLGCRLLLLVWTAASASVATNQDAYGAQPNHHHGKEKMLSWSRILKASCCVQHHRRPSSTHLAL